MALEEKSTPALNTMIHSIELNETEGPMKKKQKTANAIRQDVDGKMCHQCHQKRTPYVDCDTVKEPSNKSCNLKFCKECAKRCYDFSVSDRDGDTEPEKWTCPVCSSTCVCSGCRRRRGLQPTGNVDAYAKMKGITAAQVFSDENLIEEAREYNERRKSIRKSGVENMVMVDVRSSPLKKAVTPKTPKQLDIGTLLFKSENGKFTNSTAESTTGPGEISTGPAPKTAVAPVTAPTQPKPPRKNPLNIQGTGIMSFDKPIKKQKAFAVEVLTPRRGQATLMSMWKGFSPSTQESASAPAATNGAAKAAPQAAPKAAAAPQLAPPKPKKVPKLLPIDPPNFEKLAVDISDALLEARLFIRANYFRFRTVVKIVHKHVNTINNANGDWTHLTYKALALAYLKQIQSFKHPRIFETLDQNELYESLKGISQISAPGAFWLEIHELLADYIHGEFSDYEEEMTMANIVSQLQYMFLGTVTAREKLDADDKILKAKKAEYLAEKKKLQEMKKEMSGDALVQLKVKQDLLEYEMWVARRQLECRIVPALGKDHLGNEYFYYNQENCYEDNWGHWIIVKKNEKLPHPSGVEKEDICKETMWFCLYDSKETRILHSWLLREASKVEADTKLDPETQKEKLDNLNGLAKFAMTMSQFYAAEEKARELHMDLEPSLAKGV